MSIQIFHPFQLKSGRELWQYRHYIYNSQKLQISQCNLLTTNSHHKITVYLSH